jgi:hypothetical protein
MATKKSKNDELRVNPQSGGIEMKGPQFYAFLDTNAWVYRVRLLRAPLGKALKHGVLNRFGRFGMSEVVQFEVVEHATRLLLDRAEDARSAIDSLSEVLGKTLKVEVPNPAEAAAIVESWMKNVQAVSKCLSMDIRHARSALNRVLRKEPPNKPRNKANGKPDEGKNGQQFKDSVIWEHVRELADEAPVHFVTDDTDFFQDMKYENGLAAALLSDANSARYEITVFRDVGTLITHLGGG